MYNVETAIVLKGACSGLDKLLKYTTKPLHFSANLCQVQRTIYQSFREPSGVPSVIVFFLRVLLMLQDNCKLSPDL
jgi:hypothetical protein